MRKHKTGKRSKATESGGVPMRIRYSSGSGGNNSREYDSTPPPRSLLTLDDALRRDVDTASLPPPRVCHCICTCAFVSVAGKLSVNWGLFPSKSNSYHLGAFVTTTPVTTPNQILRSSEYTNLTFTPLSPSFSLDPTVTARRGLGVDFPT